MNRYQTLFKNVVIGVLAVLCQMTVYSQSPYIKSLLGTWEAIDPVHYPGGPGQAFDDSCLTKLVINKINVKDSSFSGFISVYFLVDSSRNYWKAPVNGVIYRDNYIYFPPANNNSIKQKLESYPSIRWCNEAWYCSLVQKGNFYFLESQDITQGCYAIRKSLRRRVAVSLPAEPKSDSVMAIPAKKPVTDTSSNRNPVNKQRSFTAATNNEMTASPLTKMYQGRKQVLVEDLEVESDSLTIDFYDDATIDNDSITVFVNQVPVLIKARLTASPVSIRIKLNNTKPFDEIGMFANNLGDIPPNTALMVIKDSKKQYEIFMKSNLDTNAVVRIRRARH